MKGNYTEPLDKWDFGLVLTVKDFLEEVECGMYIDYDGSGFPVKEGLVDISLNVYPSEIEKIPTDADHIVWFNK